MFTIHPRELMKWISEEKKFLLIDVREDFEREIDHMGGMHIPFNEVISRKEELPTEEPVVFYCEKGIRSGLIIQRLENLGFGNLYNLSGGMQLWRKFPI